MSFQDDRDLLFLGNTEFTVFATGSIDNEFKKEIISKVFPSGSRWKSYTGARSIAFFPLQSIKNKYAIVYSVIRKDINMPIISFVTIIGEYRSRLILSHGQRGIENLFLRKLGVFLEFNEKLSNVLKENVVAYKSFTGVKSNGIVKQVKHGQKIFLSSYTNPFQWAEVEASIVKTAFPSNKARLSSFRSFTLSQETDFEFLGLVQGR